MSSDDFPSRPTQPRPGDVHAHAAGFDIIGMPGAYQLRDTCPSNNWGTLPQHFRTLDGAVRDAWRCHDFKRGERHPIAPIEDLAATPLTLDLLKAIAGCPQAAFWLARMPYGETTIWDALHALISPETA
jgi:hypothetical protein